MEITRPQTLILCNGGNIEHIANCTSVCYYSNPSDPEKMFHRLVERGHLSMLRHASFYYKVPTNKLGGYYIQYFRANPYCHIHKSNNKFFYIVINGQFQHEHRDIIEKSGIAMYNAAKDDFLDDKDAIRLIRLTFIIDTQIAVTRELNRVSPNNIAERSTRYIDFLRKLGIRFSKPHWYDGLNILRRVLARLLMRLASASYRIARSKYGLGLKAEDARYFLPLGVESQVAYTYTIAEWQKIVEKRYHDSTGRAHQDCKTVIKPIHDKIHEFLSEHDAQ